jgi:hypothetical protein
MRRWFTAITVIFLLLVACGQEQPGGSTTYPNGRTVAGTIISFIGGDGDIEIISNASFRLLGNTAFHQFSRDEKLESIRCESIEKSGLTQSTDPITITYDAPFVLKTNNGGIIKGVFYLKDNTLAYAYTMLSACMNNDGRLPDK